MSFSHYQNLFRKITILAAALALPALAAAPSKSGWRPLFNGKDLAGWESYLAAPPKTSNVPGAEKDAKGNYTKPFGLNNDPLHCFTVITTDGAPAIRVSGEGNGVLSTKENFSNYHLRLEFKWGDKRFTSAAPRPRGGGLMYHAHGEYGALKGGWMHAVQYQIAEGTIADFIVMGDSTGTINVRKDTAETKKPVYDPAGVPVLFAVPDKLECQLAENFEKPAGQWNTLEIIAVGDKAIHILNGHVVARIDRLSRKTKDATAPLTGGKIQLQMEGSEEIFRNIEIRPIDAIPAEYAK